MKKTLAGFVVVSDSGPMTLDKTWPFTEVRDGALRAAKYHADTVTVFASRRTAHAAIVRTVMHHWRKNSLAELGGEFKIKEARHA